ncbi:hypothetical protein, partial [Vreelandella alkaliphila]|uniref:hypothetical protein n=1 Tax=Vreelandella alkaliphila TaxID=272774 RepID=UPI003FD6F384
LLTQVFVDHATVVTREVEAFGNEVVAQTVDVGLVGDVVAVGNLAGVGDVTVVVDDEVVTQLRLTCHREVVSDIDVGGGDTAFIDGGVIRNRQFFGDVHRGRVDAFQVRQ